METALSIVSVIMVIAVFLSRIRNDYWIYRILEYPRVQKLVIVTLIMCLWAFYWPPEALYQKIIFGALVLSVFYLIYKIWPYTTLAKKEMEKVASTHPDNEIRIFSANVLQDNTKYDAMLQQIKECDPDLVFLLETNKAWDDATKELKKRYPHTLLAPLENTYGLLFYSRLPMEDASIKYLVKNDIPSIKARINLPSGKQIQLYGLHPEPPVPGENLYATAKDKELMKVALTVKEDKLPVIIFGDLNDVAWSHTTELFRKTSETLDPRRGRGFYSTFSALSRFVRFPLDYVFCTREFSLINMRRMPPNGSDHFAMFIHLTLRDDGGAGQEPPKADKEEREEAEEMADQGVKE